MAVRIAYLVNQYPKVSHSFIRREIQALERQGAEIERYALRGWESELVDAEDRSERERTRYVLREGIVPVIGGLLLGTIGAALISRAIAALLYGLSAVDPVAFGAAGAFLIAASILAAWIPARRAARVDPLIALRAE